jgi:hypothetical protein
MRGALLPPRERMLLTSAAGTGVTSAKINAFNLTCFVRHGYVIQFRVNHNFDSVSYDMTFARFFFVLFCLCCCSSVHDFDPVTCKLGHSMCQT